MEDYNFEQPNSVADKCLQAMETFKILETIAIKESLFTRDFDAWEKLNAVGFPIQLLQFSTPIKVEEVNSSANQEANSSFNEERKDPLVVAPILHNPWKAAAIQGLPCFLRSDFRKKLVMYQKTVICQLLSSQSEDDQQILGFKSAKMVFEQFMALQSQEKDLWLFTATLVFPISTKTFVDRVTSKILDMLNSESLGDHESRQRQLRVILYSKLRQYYQCACSSLREFMTPSLMRTAATEFFCHLEYTGILWQEGNALAFLHLLHIYMIDSLIAYVDLYRDASVLTICNVVTMVANLSNGITSLENEDELSSFMECVDPSDQIGKDFWANLNFDLRKKINHIRAHMHLEPIDDHDALAWPEFN